MRQLLPTYDHDVDLATAYSYPGELPWIRANMVSSIDGSAVHAGSSRALSGEADRKVLGVLRGLSDVVLVGAGTARTERYRGLRARPAFAAHRASVGQRPAPALVVVSRRLDLDPTSPLFQGDERAVVVTCEASDRVARARLAEVAEVIAVGDEEVDLPAALDELAGRGLRRVLCEGGPSLLAELVAAGRLDELCLTLAPLLVGGSAPRILSGPAIDARHWRLAQLLEEDDVLFTRYVAG